MKPVAYSYQRCSSPRQVSGDTFRRQQELTLAFCAKNKLTLDTTLDLRDRGKSAFHGAHTATGALRRFLDFVSEGRIAPGSYLVIEKIDRLERGQLYEALGIFKQITDAGIFIATTEPERTYDSTALQGVQALELVLHFILANEESQKKSDRGKHKWAERRKHLATNKLPYCPAWLKHNAKTGKYDPIPEAVATIKHIFSLAQGGMGYELITRRLNEEKIKPIGKKSHWVRSYIKLLLSDRRLLGEYRPHVWDGHRRIETGEVIPDYYTPILTEYEFYSVQRQRAHRAKNKGGKPDNTSNLFSGLIKSAVDGSAYILRTNERGKWLVSSGHMAGVANNHHRIDYTAFEQAVLAALPDVQPKSKKDNEPSKLDELNEKLAVCRHKIEELQTEIMNGASIAPYRSLLTKLDTQRIDLEKQIEQLKSSPASFTKLLKLFAPEETADLEKKAKKIKRRAKAEGREQLNYQDLLGLVEPSEGKALTQALQQVGVSTSKDTRGRHKALIRAWVSGIDLFIVDGQSRLHKRAWAVIRCRDDSTRMVEFETMRGRLIKSTVKNENVDLRNATTRKKLIKEK